METFEPRVEQERILLEWEGLSRLYKPMKVESARTPVVIAILVAVVLVIAMEWVLILLLSALVFAYYAWTMVPPEKVVYKITSRGIRVGGTLYEWGRMGNWWREQRQGMQVIVVESAQAMLGKLYLPVDSVQSQKVSEVLGMMLIHNEPAPRMVDRAGNWLRKKLPVMGEK